MNTERVTIRNIDREAITGLRETAKFNDMTLGEAASEAILAWLSGLPEVNPDEEFEDA